MAFALRERRTSGPIPPEPRQTAIAFEPEYDQVAPADPMTPEPNMGTVPSPRRELPKPGRSLAAILLSALVCILAPVELAGQTQSLPAPPPGQYEAGVPDFLVLGPEALGLGSAPVDLRRLPDGRFVAAALRQIAIGDGSRWDVFTQVDRDAGSEIESLMVGADGKLYSTTGDAVGVIRFNEESRWWCDVAKRFPIDREQRRPNLVYSAQVAGEWYWYGTSGSIARWSSTDELRYLGSVNTISSLFEVSGTAYVSDAANGRLYRIDTEKLVPLLVDTTRTGDFAITGSAPLGGGRVLLGTSNRGLLVFDGSTLTEAPRPAILTPGHRITALCALAPDLFAAAVENYGLIFFDRAGRTVQVLDKTNDHRLAYIRQLLPGEPGELWALLRSGIARVAIPSPFSRIEPLVENGFTFALPLRHQQRLWLCANGIPQRGDYDENRLSRFIPDAPPGCYVYQLFPDSESDTLLATTDKGLWILRDNRWSHAIDVPAGMHLFARQHGGTSWFYTAPGEIGRLRRAGDGTYVLERTPAPGLNDSFGGVCDQNDVVWIELGSGKCARVDLRASPLQLEQFDQRHGLRDSWVQIFLYRGEAKAIVGGRVLRHDPAAARFVTDEEFTRRFPSLIPGIVGRPVLDSNGRFWALARGNINVFDDTGPTPRRIDLPYLYGLRPYYSVAQDDGVIWMQRNNALIRYDPAFTSPPARPLRALIGRVHLLADNRSYNPVDNWIPPIPAASNSIAVHFFATGSPLGATVTFETRFSDLQKEWVQSGAGGVAVFNRLKEGAYDLQVRPRIGDLVGEEVHLSFVVLPPWYRTTLAYSAYALSVLVLFATVAWVSSYLERREKRRLAQVVAARTAQLHESNLQLTGQVEQTMRKATALSLSEERYRHLNETLEKRVADRTAELAAINRELEAFSYSVSHDLRAPLRNISGFAELLNKDLSSQLGSNHTRYLGLVTSECARLGQLIDSLLSFSRLGRAELRRGPCALDTLVAAVRDELSPALADRHVEWRIGPLPTVDGDPTLLRQVLANLLGNAVKFSRQRDPAIIEIGELPSGPETAEHVIFVRDNGAGFDPQYTEKLFGVFQRLHRVSEFEGTGIGLANVRRIVARHGGRVWAEGQPDRGATFYFALPRSVPISGT